MSVMLVGAACHFEHHLLDPDCGSSTSHSSQPCATCAGLHGAATAAHANVTAEPVVLPLAVVALPERAYDPAGHACSGSPLAPPSA